MRSIKSVFVFVSYNPPPTPRGSYDSTTHAEPIPSRVARRCRGDSHFSGHRASVRRSSRGTTYIDKPKCFALRVTKHFRVEFSPSTIFSPRLATGEKQKPDSSPKTHWMIAFVAGTIRLPASSFQRHHINTVDTINDRKPTEKRSSKSRYDSSTVYPSL
jgi:hypothetical protein